MTTPSPSGDGVVTLWESVKYRPLKEAACRSTLPAFQAGMIFGGAHDGWQERYASREEALAGHAHTVALARAGLGAAAR